jgi:Putative phage tail protein
MATAFLTCALKLCTVDGMIVTSRTSVRASLEQLREAFLYDASEYDSKINFFKRPGASLATVPFADIGFMEGESAKDNDDPEPSIKLRRRQGLEIPREVNVNYISSSRDYENGSQSYRRENFQGEEVKTLSFSIVLSDDRALQLAKIHAVTGWNERVPGEFTLPPDYMIYAAGAVLTFEIDEVGTTVEMRVDRIALGAPGLVRVSCTEQLASAYTQSGSGASGEVVPGGGSVQPIRPTDTWFSDRFPFFDGEQGRAGHYVAGQPEPGTAGVWSGSAILRDIDGAGDYREHVRLVDQATMGRTTTVLAAGTGIDTTHTVDVQLDDESLTLVSITDDAFTNDPTANLAALGDETIQYRDALDLGDGLYRLSHIRREMRGTLGTGATHALDERFVLINKAVKRVEINKEEIGTTLDFYPVSYGDSVDNSTPFSFTYGGKGIEPGGTAPSTVQNDTVQSVNGQSVLQWDAPSENTLTLKSYRVTVYSDPAMTIPVSGFEDVEVAGRQFVLPVEA